MEMQNRVLEFFYLFIGELVKPSEIRPSTSIEF